MIWDEPDEIALIGDYDKGVAHLLQALERVPHPAVKGLAEEAQTFLTAKNNQNRYFLMEGNEVFWLGDKTPVQQTDDLLAELADLGPQMDKFIDELKARMYEEEHPPGFFARLFGAKTPVRRDNSNDRVNALGLGGWCNTLYYDLND